LCVGIVDGRVDTLAEVERFEVGFRLVVEDAGEDLSRLGALEGDETLAVEDGPLNGLVWVLCLPSLELLFQVCRVLFSAAGIGDDVELVFEAGDYCVVDDAAGLGVEEGGESGLVFWEGGYGGGCYALEEGLGAGAGEVMLDP
jgi:hypothetical protein